MFQNRKLRNTFLIAVLAMSSSLSAQKNPAIKYKFLFYKYHNNKKVKYLHFQDEIKVHLYSMPFKDNRQIIQNTFGESVKPDSGSQYITYTGTINTKNDDILSIKFTGEDIETTEYTADTDYRMVKPMQGGTSYSKMDSLIRGKQDTSGPPPVFKNDTAVKFNFESEQSVVYNTYQTETRHIDFYCDSVVNIKLNKIDYVTFENPGNFTQTTFNGVVLCASFAGALLIAPAASIDYAHGGFNTHRYYGIMVPSLICFSIDLPLYFIMNRERKYKVHRYIDLGYCPSF